MAKPWARSFYSSKAWQECRNEYGRRRHWLCEDCMQRGLYKPGEIVHHVIELDPVNIERPEITLNPENLRLVCRECHARIHDQRGGRWEKFNAERKEKQTASRRYKIDENGKVSANTPPMTEKMTKTIDRGSE